MPDITSCEEAFDILNDPEASEQDKDAAQAYVEEHDCDVSRPGDGSGGSTPAPSPPPSPPHG